MADDDEAQHHLAPYLSRALPSLGLDYEAYGPYVIGFARTTDDEDDREEALDDLMELLRASSENNNEDVLAWNEFRAEIVQRSKLFHEDLARKKEQRLVLLNQQQMERRSHQIELAKRAEMEEDERQKTQKEMDPTKRALAERFMYEEEDDEEDGIIKKGGAEDVVDISNREVATRLHRQTMEQRKAVPVQTKKGEREKTNMAKKEKATAKEERRKRAQKGERKR